MGEGKQLKVAQYDAILSFVMERRSRALMESGRDPGMNPPPDHIFPHLKKLTDLPKPETLPHQITVQPDNLYQNKNNNNNINIIQDVTSTPQTSSYMHHNQIPSNDNMGVSSEQNNGQSSMTTKELLDSLRQVTNFTSNK